MSRLSTWPAIALLAAIAVSVQADDAPTCPTPDQPTENAPDHGICANAGSDPREEEFEDSFWGCLQYHTLLEKNYPGICDVDASTPDGKAKIDQAMSQTYIPQVREKMLANLKRERADMAKILGVTAADFAAIEPFVEKIQQLQLEKQLAAQIVLEYRCDHKNDPFFEHRKFMNDRWGADPKGQVIDRELLVCGLFTEDASRKCVEAHKKLTTLLMDPESSDAEIALAQDAIRQANLDFDAATKKAEANLKHVLTNRQEAKMIDLGLLN